MRSTPATAFNDAEAVFIGKMLGGTEKLQNKIGEELITIEAGEVRFAIEEVFKGTVKGDITISVPHLAGISCGPYGLLRDVRYIVYAYKSKSGEELLYTGVCTRTRPVYSQNNSEDLEFLRKLPAPGSGGKIEGRVWYDSRLLMGGGAVAMPNISILIRSMEGSEIVVTTDEEGAFEAENLKAGNYQVKPLVGGSFYLSEELQTAEVADRGTVTVGFEAYFTGSVSGFVVDGDGRSYNSIFLTLDSLDVSDEKRKQIYGHSTGTDGEFEFSGVPPGEYIISLELQHSSYEKNKEYYYPGTYDRGAATAITIDLEGKVEGLKFVLPEEFKVRVLEGTVFWGDGTPAADADVALLCPSGVLSSQMSIESGSKTTRTDEEGRFKIEVFAGQTYWLYVKTNKESSSEGMHSFYSEAKKIQVGDNLKKEKFILSRTDGPSERWSCR